MRVLKALFAIARVQVKITLSASDMAEIAVKKARTHAQENRAFNGDFGLTYFVI